MKSFVRYGVGGALLVFGLLRIGVVSLLLGQLFGVYEIAAFIEPIEDTQKFLSVHNSDALIPLTATSYFAVLVAMGLSLTLGAYGALRRAKWGLALIALYLAMHAGLFVNFLTINPKIVLVFAGAALLGALVWANREE